MRNRKQTIHRLAFLGVCTSVALVLAWIEAILPPLFTAFPGIKLGLPNIVILFVLYRYGVWYAAAVSLVRVVIISMLFGNVDSFLLSLTGAVLSLVGMALLKRLGLFSTVGVSVVGGILHNVGQVLMAVIILQTSMLWYYLVALLLTGIVSGVFVGLCGGFAVKRFGGGSTPR